jgi:hypothetical protein
MKGKNIVNKLLFSHNDLEMIKTDDDIKNIITDKFHSDLIYLKIIIIVLLIVASFINKYTDFIKKKPIAFGCETIFYSIMGTLPFLYMEKYRKNENDHHYLKIFILMFGLYSLFNILFEISGLYSYMYEEENEEEYEEDLNTCKKNISKKDKIFNNINLSISVTFMILLIYIIFILILISYEVFDFNIDGYKNNKFKLFGLETLIFALCNALPFLLIAYNRQDKHFNIKKNLVEILLLFIKFAIFHVMLQTSGFYKSELGY